MTEGYITMAFGHEKYFKQAWSLAKTIGLRDGKRPISLLYHGKVPDQYAGVFSHLIPMRLPLLKGYLDKMYFYELSPFEKTIYIDSDCLLVKDDIDFWWKTLNGTPLTVTGDIKKSGHWGGWTDIAEICKKANVPYVVTMNGGVIYAEKCVTTSSFFDTVFDLYHNHRDWASWRVQSVDGYNDEPLMAIAMGKHNLKPAHEIKDKDGYILCLQRSTLNSKDWTISLPRKTCRFNKGKSLVSPTILHLCAYSRYNKLKSIIEDQYAWIDKYHSK